MPLTQEIQVSSDIVLKPHQTAYAEDLFKVIDRYRNDLAPFLHWVRFNRTPEDAQQFALACENHRRQKRAAVWVIEVDGAAAGTVSFHPDIDWHHKTAVLGYWLSPAYQGRGIACRSVAALMDAFSHLLDTFVLKIASHNKASTALAERLGFVWLRRDTAAELIGNMRYDQNIYRKTLGPPPHRTAAANTNQAV